MRTKLTKGQRVHIISGQHIGKNGTIIGTPLRTTNGELISVDVDGFRSTLLYTTRLVPTNTNTTHEVW